MRSNISSVAGWFVPARGIWSRKLSSRNCSIRQTFTPACASASDRQRPTGPAPMMTMRSDVVAMSARELCALGFRHHFLGGADPAGVGEVEHDAERVLVLGLVVRLFRGRAAVEIFPAGA